MDLQVAATVTRYGLLLLTGNGKDFAGPQSTFGVPTRDPADSTARLTGRAGRGGG